MCKEQVRPLGLPASVAEAAAAAAAAVELKRSREVLEAEGLASVQVVISQPRVP